MKDIPGYEGLYAATSCGRIWSYRSKKFLKPIAAKDGYQKVNLYKNGKMKTCQIHRLIAATFIPNVNNYLEVNHKDFVKTNNTVNNLEWCDHAYNMRYNALKV